ncbi:MAG: ketoacyl-ACP synthase III [Planctomycetes bacterium]|nr:ketoacyl-ACP synthase III [Planctomycetota bacterium]
MDKIQKVSIVSTGSYAPDKILSNDDLEKLVETSDEWITTRTGIKERHMVVEGEATSDLAARAAQNALKESGLTPEQLDLIVIGTVSPDNLFPSTACHVQRKINAPNAAAFDISAACTGFLYSLTAGWKMIATGMHKNALVIGAETLTRLTDYTDRGTCVLFGDGAGAVILQPGDQGHEILYGFLGADGTRADLMILPAGASSLPASHKTVDEKLHYIKLRGREVFKFAVLKMADLVKESIEKCNLKMSDISLVVPHQVNMRILESAAERLNMPIDKFYVNIDKYGNTSAASIPIAFDEVARSGRLKKGDIVVLVAFGGGLTWGSAVIRW